MAQREELVRLRARVEQLELENIAASDAVRAQTDNAILAKEEAAVALRAAAAAAVEHCCIAELEAEVTRLREECAGLTAERDAAHTLARAERESLQRRIAAAEAELRTQRDEGLRAAREGAQRAAECDRLRAAHRALEQRYSAAVAAAEAAAGEARTWQERTAALDSAAAEREAGAARLQRELLQSARAAEQWTQRAAEAESALKQMRKELTHSEERDAERSAELKGLQEAVQRGAAADQEVQRRVSESLMLADEHRSKEAEAEGERLQELEEALGSVEEERREAERRVAEVEAELEAAQLQVGKLQSALDEAARRQAESDREHRGESLRLRQEAAVARRDRDAACAECDRMRAAAAAGEAAAASQAQASGAVAEDERRRAEQADAELSRLQGQLAAAAAAQQQMTAAFEQCTAAERERATRAREEARLAREQAAAAEQQARQAVAEAEGLRQQAAQAAAAADERASRSASVLQSSAEALRRRLAAAELALEEQREEAAAERVEWRQRLAALEERAAAEGRRAEEAQTQAARAQGGLSSCEAALRAAREREDAQAKELAVARAHAAEKDALVARVSALATDLDDRDTRLRQAAAEVLDLQAEAAAAVRAAEEARQRGALEGRELRERIEALEVRAEQAERLQPTGGPAPKLTSVTSLHSRVELADRPAEGDEPPTPEEPPVPEPGVLRRRVDELAEEVQQRAADMNLSIVARPELVRALWDLLHELGTAKQELSLALATPETKRALARVPVAAGVVGRALRSVGACREQAKWIVANFLTEVEKMHLGASEWHYAPEGSTPTAGRRRAAEAHGARLARVLSDRAARLARAVRLAERVTRQQLSPLSSPAASPRRGSDSGRRTPRGGQQSPAAGSPGRRRPWIPPLSRVPTRRPCLGPHAARQRRVSVGAELAAVSPVLRRALESGSPVGQIAADAHTQTPRAAGEPA